MSDGLPRLDAGARKALALAAAAGRPPVQQMSPAEARDAARANQRLFDAEPPPTRRDDLFAPGIAGEIALRRYRPLDPENGGPVPALIFFHGGGWVTGDLDHGAWLCASLACQLGITVVSVGYRLAPEHPFPAAVEDSIAALEWVAANADALGLDPARLAVGGDSAGGALAAVAALHARDTGLTLRAQILLYPVTDNGDEHASYARNGAGYGLTAEGMRWYRAHYLGAADPRDWRASPLRADRLEGSPPAFLLSCGFDPLCDEAIAYGTRLRDAGVAVRHSHYEDQIHGFLTRAAVIGEAGRALDEIVAMLRDRLLDNPR